MPRPAHPYRHKGKWIKKAVMEKQLKAAATVSAANTKKAKPKVSLGTRVADFDELAANLQCRECGGILSMLNTQKLVKRGLHTILSVQCDVCETITSVPISKNIGDRKIELNIGIALGMSNLQ